MRARTAISLLFLAAMAFGCGPEGPDTLAEATLRPLEQLFGSDINAAADTVVATATGPRARKTLAYNLRRIAEAPGSVRDEVLCGDHADSLFPFPPVYPHSYYPARDDELRPAKDGPGRYDPYREPGWDE